MLEVATMPNSASLDTYINETGIVGVINVYGVAISKVNNLAAYPLPSVDANNANYNIGLVCTTPTSNLPAVRVITKSDWSSYKALLTVEYYR